MSFRHLDYPTDAPVEELGAAAIDDLLDRGDLESWTPLARAVREAPWAELAETVLRLCDAHPMYGTSSLWQAWIARLRERWDADVATLAELRARAGLTQEQVGERMGISQSDVSKLERRGDLKLTTLRAYVAALEGTLEVGIRFLGDAASTRIRLSRTAKEPPTRRPRAPRG